MGRKLGGGVQKVKEARMRTVLFVVALLTFIGVGSAVLYGIGEMIVNQQDATSYIRVDREERKDGK